jgi:hypothetical protein
MAAHARLQARPAGSGEPHGARRAGGELDCSPAMQAQRRRIGRSFGAAVQLAGGLFLVDAGEPVGQNQIAKDDFLARLNERVLALAKDILGPYGLAQDDCPDLRYWMSRYREQDAAHAEQVILRYAPATQDAADWQAYLALLVARVRLGLEEHTRTGTPVDPEPMPDSLDRRRPPLTVFGIGSQGQPAQLKCGSSSGEDDGPHQRRNGARTITPKEKVVSKPSKPERTYTLEDVKGVTREGYQKGVTLSISLGGEQGGFSEDDLRDMFGVDGEDKHVSMESIAKSGFGGVGKPEEDRLEFSNMFGPRGWIMGENFKDPSLVEGSIYMNEVVEYQWLQSGVKEDIGGLKYLVRRHVVSEDGKKFFLKHGFEDKQRMTDEQLQEFLTETPNGKSSARILQSHDDKLFVAAAYVLYRDGFHSIVLTLGRK